MTNPIPSMRKHGISYFVLIMVIALIIDRAYTGSSALAKGVPDFSPDQLIRCLLFAFAVLAALAVLPSQKIAAIRSAPNITLSRTSFYRIFFIPCFLLSLFYYSPKIFSKLSREDRLIEYSSALFLLAGCIYLLYGLRYAKKISGSTQLLRLMICGLAGLYFLIAMEEISWLQRILEIDTPELFSNNIQNETNLHNFATEAVENIYYLGTCVFLVVIPFLYLHTHQVNQWAPTKIFIADPGLIVIATIPFAYNYTMWNISLIQLCLFICLGILARFAFSASDNNLKRMSLFTLALLVVTQGLFLAHGDKLKRSWELTEYKEFFISLCLFVYAKTVVARLKNQPAHPDSGKQPDAQYSGGL